LTRVASPLFDPPGRPDRGDPPLPDPAPPYRAVTARAFDQALLVSSCLSIGALPTTTATKVSRQAHAETVLEFWGSVREKTQRRIAAVIMKMPALNRRTRIAFRRQGREDRISSGNGRDMRKASVRTLNDRTVR